MSGQVFGDLELGKSFGISANQSKVNFLKPRVLLYVSGNCLNCIELNNSKEIKSEANPAAPNPVAAATPNPAPTPALIGHENVMSIVGHCHADSQIKVLVGEGQITAFATMTKDNIIAYSEIYSGAVKLVRWSPASGVMVPIATLPITGDISVEALAFSADGLYLAALGGLPLHQITVWEWRTQKVIVTSSNGVPAQYISFNPIDSKEFCTSGTNGKIIFWKIQVGFKKFTLASKEGATSQKDALSNENSKIELNPWQLDVGDKYLSLDKAPSPVQHLWIPDKKVLSISADGKQIYKYDSVKGTYQIFLDANGSERQFMSVIQNARNMMIAEKGGVISILNLQGDLVRTLKLPENEEIVSMSHSPDYQRVLVEAVGGKFYFCDMKKLQTILMKIENTNGLNDMITLPTEKMIITSEPNGTINYWLAEKQSEVQKFTINGSISVLNVSHASSMLIVGSESGIVRFYNCRDMFYHAPKLVFRKKMHKNAVQKFAIDGSGTLLASAGNDGHVVLYDLEKCSVLGYINLPGGIKSMKWEICEEAGLGTRLYILQNDSLDETSSISVYDIPEKDKIEASSYQAILKDSAHLFHTHVFTVNAKANDFLVSPKATMASKNQFYIMTSNGYLRIYSAHSVIGQSDHSTLNTLLHEFKEHEGFNATLKSNPNGEWIYTYGKDGLITLRSILEPEKAVKIVAHDGALGGVFSCTFSYNYRYLMSIGYDGLSRRWDWKYNPSSRRAAAELSDSIEKQVLDNGNVENAHLIDSMQEIPDPRDSEDDKYFIDGEGETHKRSEESADGIEAFNARIQEKIGKITLRMVDMMENNEKVPDLEKVERSEFVIDLKEKERLIQETDNMIAAIKKEQEIKNMKKRVLRNRIKKECWDSSQIYGQTIKSFKPNRMLGDYLEVSNFPIRKLSSDETLLISNIKRLRRVQLLVTKNFQENQVEPEKVAEVTEPTEEHGQQAPVSTNPTKEAPQSEKQVAVTSSDLKQKFSQSENAKLLYSPFELNTKERHRMQTFLLYENIQEIKSSFNQSFYEFFKTKQDEMAKIEERNERISSIISQLQINESIVRPELDENEIPDSVIKVLDSEIKVERFLTAEELAKLEAKRLAAEERLRLQGEDNFRQRALMDMMNGKLEDRKAMEEKEEITRPEWMNKPKDELTDDERKLIKEFEKKMAIFKEEQEKHRKALETELRKLQSAISELQDAFDVKLFSFFQFKLNVDSIIFEKELSMIKETQFAITQDNDNQLEAKIISRIEDLKQAKIDCTNEIPEIKKELEKCREEYDVAVRKDKELEKQFKKEFHVHEIFFDSLSRLFKRRVAPTSAEKDAAEGEDLSPFTLVEKESSNMDFTPVTLNQATDLPDGLNIDIWNKLIEIRDKKIASETEVYVAGRNLKEMQSLVQGVLEESDQIKAEMEKTQNDLAQFLDYKIRNIFNLECLFEFKQGQVEVPQAPIVTNYKDAVLLHRSVVESLNDQVRHLGQLKVEALTEMKDYRKGIHALEWENKMHDYQAEDLIIRSRDIQLLRVTKEMQEYLRNGDNHKQASEVSNLEKISEHSQKAHLHHMEEKKSVIAKLKLKRQKKNRENEMMQTQIKELSEAVKERYKVQEAKLSRKPAKNQQEAHKELFTRRRLVDLAKSQAQDIAILREELERLRLRTYPAFRAN